MKQNKTLELAKNFKFVASNDDSGFFELSIVVGKRNIKIDRETAVELNNWLSKDVLETKTIPVSISPWTKPTESVPFYGRSATELADGLNIKGPTSSGPLVVQSGQSVPIDELENRRATVTSQSQVRDLSSTTKLISSRDELQIQNLSSQVGKAQEAFSPEHIFDGGPIK